MHRCYLPSANWTAPTQLVEGEEAQHALKVMRLRVGDRCEAFDGRGSAAICRITHIDGNRAMELGVEEILPQPPALPEISLALAIPKGGNMELIVQKAVELGVSRIIPLLSERTIVRIKDKEAASKQQKWERTVLEACKQCGSNTLPIVEPVSSYKQFITRDNLPELKLCCALLPEARPMRDILEAARSKGSKQAIILVGPEGDLTTEEYQAALAAGFEAASLGHIILRVETAVFMAIAAARYALD